MRRPKRRIGRPEVDGGVEREADSSDEGMALEKRFRGGVSKLESQGVKGTTKLTRRTTVHRSP